MNDFFVIKGSFALELVFFPLAIISYAIIGIVKHTFSIHFVLFPFTHILSTFIVIENASAMPHIIEFRSFVFALEIDFWNKLQFLFGLVTRELDDASTILWNSLFVRVVVGKRKGIWAIWAIGVIDYCIDIGRWRVECCPNLLFHLFMFLFRFYCLLFLKSHVLYLHYIIIFFLNKTILLILWVAFCDCYGLFAFWAILLNFREIYIGDWFYLLNLLLGV